MNRYRPGAASERQAREAVRQHFPLATSSYTADGAEVYDPGTLQVLGCATAGDWAVEHAWQAAAGAISQSAAVK